MHPHAKHLGRLKTAIVSAQADLAEYEAARVLGRLGGRSKSPAKSEAARKNGKLGGRPRNGPSVAQEAPETAGL